MICKQCGTQIIDGALFCHACGAKVEVEQLGEKDKTLTNENIEIENNIDEADKRNNDSLSGKTEEVKTTKKKRVIITAIIVGLLVCGCAYLVLANMNIVPKFNKTNYDGVYSGIQKNEDGKETAFKVIVKDGKMTITSGTSISEKYKYNEDGDYIQIKTPADDDGEKYYVFNLVKTGGKYYLTLFAGSWLESTIEVAEGDEPAITDETGDSSNDTKNENEKSEGNVKTENNGGFKDLSKGYYIVGEDLEPGIYTFKSSGVGSDFNLYVYETMKYYKQSEEGTGDEYFDHYESYYDPDDTKGISLRKGNVIEIGYDGIKYKKQ